MVKFYEVVKPITGYEVGDRIEEGVLTPDSVKHLTAHACIVVNETPGEEAEAGVEAEAEAKAKAEEEAAEKAKAVAEAKAKHEADWAPKRAAVLAELKSDSDIPFSNGDKLRVKGEGDSRHLLWIGAQGGSAKLHSMSDEKMANLLEAVGISDPEDAQFAVLQWAVENQAG